MSEDRLVEYSKIYERYGPFFTVFNAAFKSLQSDERPPILGPLQATICASGQREGVNGADLTILFAPHLNP